MSRSRKQSSKRVAFLRERHLEQVHEHARGTICHPRLTRTPEAAFDLLLAFDPTPKAIYLQAIVQWFLNSAIQLEDGRRIRSMLAQFEGMKARMPQGSRDINRYTTPGDVEEAMAELSGSGIVAGHRFPEHLLTDMPLVAVGDGWMVRRIESAEAASHWADSTSWCTRHPHTYASYAKRGPLHAILVEGDKFQLAAKSEQFMDRRDRSVQREQFLSWPKPLQEVILPMLLRQTIRDGRTRTTSIVPASPIVMNLLGVSSGLRTVRDNYRSMAWFGMKGTKVERIFLKKETQWTWSDLSSLDKSTPCTIAEVREILRSELDALREAAPDSSKGHLVREIPQFSCFQRLLLHDDVRSQLVTAPSGKDYVVCKSKGASTALIEIHEASVLVSGESSAGIKIRDCKDLEALDAEQRALLGGVLAFNEVGTRRLDVYDVAFAPLAAPAQDETWFKHWQREAVNLVEKQNLELTPRSREDLVDVLVPTEDEALPFLCSHRGLTMDRQQWLFHGMLEKCTPKVRLLLAPLDVVDGFIVRARNVAPPSGEALLEISHVPGAGTLLASLPIKDRTPQLIDAMIDRGRGGVLMSMPSELCTLDRVAAALATGEVDSTLFARDTVSIRLLHQIQTIVRHPAEWPKTLTHALYETLSSGDDALRRSLLSSRNEWVDAPEGIAGLDVFIKHAGLSPEQPDEDKAFADIAALKAENGPGWWTFKEEVDHSDLVQLPYPMVLAICAVEPSLVEATMAAIGSNGWGGYTGSARTFLRERLVATCPKAIAISSDPMESFSETARLQALEKDIHLVMFMSPEALTPPVLTVLAERWNDDFDDESVGEYVERSYGTMVGYAGVEYPAWRKAVYEMLQLPENYCQLAAGKVGRAIPAPQDAMERRIWMRAFPGKTHPSQRSALSKMLDKVLMRA